MEGEFILLCWDFAVMKVVGPDASFDDYDAVSNRSFPQV
jgi:hypothetical protein